MVSGAAYQLRCRYPFLGTDRFTHTDARFGAIAERDLALVDRQIVSSCFELFGGTLQ